jgi:hypothetical protein
MLKKVIIAGLMGGLTLIIWVILINGLLGYKHRMDMKKRQCLTWSVCITQETTRQLKLNNLWL